MYIKLIKLLVTDTVTKLDMNECSPVTSSLDTTMSVSDCNSLLDFELMLLWM